MSGLIFLTLVASGSLVGITGLRHFFLDPTDSSGVNWLLFVIQILPLLAVLPGLLRASHRSAVIAALVAMLYFIHGVWLAATPELRVVGLIEVGVALALVVSSSYLARAIARS